MIALLRNLEWKPSTVSWLSFVLMGFIVAAIGLSGTAHVVNYLQERLTAHGIAHNQEIAAALVPKFSSIFEDGAARRMEKLGDAIEIYKAFGFEILIIDRERRAVIADSESTRTSPLPIEQSWLARASGFAGPEGTLPLETGAVRAFREDGHPMLVWLQEVPMANSDPWLLGIVKDQKWLTEFMGDLHWHLDAVMLLTYVLITLLGYFAMRSIGRLYERRLESEVQARTRELEVAHKEMLGKTRLATIGQTASVLTHEMRNPLASIKLALSGLKSTVDLPDREHRRVGLVLGEVDRLDAMLSETLDYVRPVKLSAQPVALGGLLAQVLKQQEPVLDEKGIRLKWELHTGDTAIQLDEAQMHQVLLNLFKNAVEASPQGGEIGVSLQREGGDLVLEMENDGEPMSAEALQRAFEPFFTTKPKGTGLGLGLVKRVVEEHGGTVTLASNVGIGTRLTLTFPLNPL
jgi:signal transduction histidine kinase